MPKFVRFLRSSPPYGTSDVAELSDAAAAGLIAQGAATEVRRVKGRGWVDVPPPTTKPAPAEPESAPRVPRAAEPAP